MISSVMAWRRTWLGMLALLAAPVFAQNNFPNYFERWEPDPGVPGRDVSREYIRYGDLSGQEISFRPARQDTPAPLVVIIDDRYWRNDQPMSDDYLPGFLYEQGYASASIQSRAYPEPEAAEAIADLAAAIARLRDESAKLGIDMSRMILVGRGSAAWAAALLATDPSHAAAAGLDFSAIKGAVLINGDGMDLAARAAESPRLRNGDFADFFEGDEALTLFSPVTHLGPPDAPAFLLLVEERRSSAQASAHSFAEQLSAASIANEIVTIERYRANSRSGEIGGPRNRATPALERFMADAFERWVGWRSEPQRHRRLDAGQTANLQKNGLAHRLIDREQQHRLAPCRTPPEMEGGDVDAGIAQRGADAADEARPVLVDDIEHRAGEIGLDPDAEQLDEARRILAE